MHVTDAGSGLFAGKAGADPMCFRYSPTPEQKKATAFDRNLAVTAGAGSGKTTILVDRYFHILKTQPNMSAENIVAITFTRKAAAEMKERIAARIQSEIGNPDLDTESRRRWQRAQFSLHAAPITTIHAFAAELLREFSLPAGLDPAFSIVEEMQFDEMKRRAVQQALAAAEKNSSDVLAEVLSYFPQNALEKLLMQWIGRPERMDYLREFVAKPENPEDLWRLIQRFFPNGLHWKQFYVTVQNFGTIRGRTAEKYRIAIVSALEKILAADIRFRFTGLDQLFDALFQASGKPRGIKSWNELKPVAEQLQSLLQPLIYLRNIYDPEVEAAAGKLVGYLLKLAEPAEKQLTQARSDTGFMTFDDLERYAFQLLNRSPFRYGILHVLRKRYRYVMIDEFQDTNPVQWNIIKPLVSDDSGTLLPDCLFIVGDPKQSIYGFRGADVRVFNAVRSLIKTVNRSSGMQDRPLPEGNTADTSDERLGDIRLTDNFRSVQPVLRFVEKTLLPVMQPGRDFEVAFEALKCNRRESTGKVGILIPQADPEASENPHIWADILASHILSFVDSGAVQFGDIAVMFPRRTRLSVLKSRLHAFGVPFEVYKGVGFWQQIEVSDMISIVQWLANPADKLALYAVLRSPVFGLSDDALLHIAENQEGFPLVFDPETARKVLTPAEMESTVMAQHTLHHALQSAGRVPLTFLLENLLESTGAWGVYQAFRDGDRLCANLEKFLDYIAEMEHDGVISPGEPARWLTEKYFSDLQEGEAGTPDISGNKVHLMTIHAAKGLEFPVVYLTELENRGKYDSATDYFHPELGVGVSIPARISGERPLITARYPILRNLHREMEFAEYKRLFYVGMTRARDALFLVHRPSKYKDIYQLTGKSETWLDWITRALELSPQDAEKTGKTLTMPDGFQFTVDLITRVEHLPKENPSRMTPEELLKAADRMPVTVPKPDVCPPEPPHLPIYSVNELIDLCQLDARTFHRSRILNLPLQFRAPDSKPKNDLSLHIGTTFHEIMEHALWRDERTWRDYVLGAADRAQLAGPRRSYFLQRLTRQVNHVRCWPELVRIYESEEYAVELSFNLKVGHAVIEGVMDMLYRTEGKWVVVDYKTDVFAAAQPLDTQLAEHTRRHSFQMMLYALAVRHIFAPDQAEIPVILYFADIGRESRLFITDTKLETFSEQITAAISQGESGSS